MTPFCKDKEENNSIMCLRIKNIITIDNNNSILGKMKIAII